jgi:hypothetical protein
MAVTISPTEITGLDTISTGGQNAFDFSTNYIKRRVPCFAVSHPSNLNAGQVLKHTQVYINIGNGYSSSTGRFTAPISGYYKLSWTSIGHSTNGVYRYKLRVNGAITSKDHHLRIDTFTSGSRYGDSGSYVIYWYLNAGDYVDILYSDGPRATYGNIYDRFEGWLMT